MFNFFRKNQESKKTPAPDKEADGFVFLGQTSAEQRDRTPPYPATDLPYSLPYQMPQGNPSTLNRNDSEAPKMNRQLSEGNPAKAELLSDIPFILAPHVLEVQNICQEMPEPPPTCNLEESFARFHYDFTLENSVLCGL